MKAKALFEVPGKGFKYPDHVKLLPFIEVKFNIEHVVIGIVTVPVVFYFKFIFFYKSYGSNNFAFTLLLYSTKI